MTDKTPQPMDRSLVRGLSVSNEMVLAAQSSYDSWEEYGISDEDMRNAIAAALKVACRKRPRGTK